MKTVDVWALYLYIFFTFGSFQVAGNGIISLILLLLWCIANINYMKTFIGKCLKDKAVCAFIIFLFGFTIFGFFKTDKVLIIKNFFNYILLFSPYLIYKFYQLESQQRKLNTIYRGLQKIFWFWIIIAMFYFVQHRGAAAAIASGIWEESYLAVGGGQLLAYGACIYCIYLLYEYWNIEKKWSSLIGIVTIYIYMLLVESMITVLVCCVGCFMVILFGDINKKQILLLILIGLVTTLLIIYYKDIADLIYSKALNWNVGMTDKLLIRVKQVLILLSGRTIDADSSYSVRLLLYMKSIETIKQNFLLGVGFQKGPLLGNGFVGEHSEVLDAFARWGILIGGMYLMSFLRPVVKRIQNGSRYIIFIAVLVMGLLNTMMVFQVTTIMLLLIPVQSQVIVKEA